MEQGRTTGSKVALGAVLFVVVAVIVAALVVSVSSRGGGSDDEAAKAGGGTDATTEPAEPALEPIMVGAHPVVQACALLPVDVVEGATKELAPRGYVDQELLARSVSEREVRQIARTVGESVDTSCRYVYNDHDLNPKQQWSTLLQVRVRNFGDAGVVRKKMRDTLDSGTGKTLRWLRRTDADPWLIDLEIDHAKESGGVKVQGVPGVLYVKGGREWVAGYGNVIVTISLGYSDFSLGGTPLTDKEYRTQRTIMTTFFATAAERIADPALVQQPLPTSLDGSTESPEGVRWLEPCEVFTADIFEQVIGRPESEQAETVSLPRSPELRRRTGSEPFTQVSSNSCARRVYESGDDGRTAYSADLDVEIRYAQDPVEALEVLGAHIIRTSFAQDSWDTLTLDQLKQVGMMEPLDDTGADSAYFFDASRLHGSKAKTRKGYFTVGPYEVQVAGSGPEGKGYSYKQHTPEQYATAMTLLAERIRELSGLDDE